MGHKYIAKKAGNTGFNHPRGGRRATMFPVDTKFPLPTGPGWRYVLEQHQLRSNNLNDDHINANLCRAAVEHEADYVRAAMKVLRTTENQTEFIACAVQALASDNTNDYDTRMKPYIDNITGKITAPKHFRNILERPDSALWQKAIKTEWDAIMDMQVLSLGWTKRKLQAAGINKPAVSARVLLDVKYKPCGPFDKYKARLIQRGHPGNCFKGFHYNEVFTATPQMVSTRILQAIRIGLCVIGSPKTTVIVLQDATGSQHSNFYAKRGFSKCKKKAGGQVELKCGDETWFVSENTVTHHATPQS